MRTKGVQVRLAGKRWTIHRRRFRVRDGTCDHPEKPFRTLVVDATLHGLRELDIYIHECLHACAWEVLREEAVVSAASGAAELLWLLRWRRVHGPSPGKRGLAEIKKVLVILLAAKFDTAPDSWVAASASDIARVLLQVGYRKA